MPQLAVIQPGASHPSDPDGHAGRGRPGDGDVDPQLERDLQTLATFIRVYCLHQHGDALKHIVHVKGHDVAKLTGGPLVLCPACADLLAHAFAKRSACPHHPKPACKHCPRHCYHPSYRARIREVMKFSGRHLVLSGRFDLLLHFLF